jgi:hypothetical protein
MADPGRRWLWLRAGLWCGLGIIGVTCAHAGTLSTHASLDWSAPLRWVHVDNVAPDRGPVFERARRGWLQALQQGDSLLADGRPLFWGHRAKERSTYFTFYPFARFADMDARGAAVRATQAAVGPDALARYDSGDSVLVAPHYTEIWRRSPDDDYVPEGGESWTELTACCGWLEVRDPSFTNGAEVDSLWTVLKSGLAAERFPLVCRVFQNVYGPRDVVCLWMAPDSTAFRAAPPLAEAMARHLGAAKAEEFWKHLDAVFPVTSSLTVERRPEMSNLGR